MDEFLLRQFQKEIERQAQFGLIALQDMDEASAGSDGKLFWYSVQGFAVAVCKVSRMLWPESPRLPERGLTLRQSLGVEAGSPLQDRSFLERFEDYEARLEQWYETSENHRFFDSYTEPLDVLAETHMGDRFRGYEMEEEALMLGGELYHLGPVADALEEIGAAAQREMKKPRFDLPRNDPDGEPGPG
ncbi:hypothetical protein [Rubrobacter aplysinae]|uniref:hypothetical protein n=1 Tax=Rubrobacter aplysinae TaxID=909625 RepID=UPI00064BE282|nr:hypothetical protein [Rubrobacter aplysinae]